MKSYWMVSDNTGSRLELRDVDTPQPGAGQVLVKMHAASLNRGEFIHGHGLHAAGSAKAAGMEGAGEIVQVGEGVMGWKAGDRVMGRCPGAFSEYALMDVREMMPVPAKLSLEEAASIPLTPAATPTCAPPAPIPRCCCRPSKGSRCWTRSAACGPPAGPRS